MTQLQQSPGAFWSLALPELHRRLETSHEGLASDHAKRQFELYGPNLLKLPKRSDVPALLLAQFKSPTILILLFAVGLSFVLHDAADAIIILAIVLVSGLLGFWQEYGASNAVAKLLSIVQINARAMRDGQPVDVPAREIVPGDVVILSAGRVIPGDGLVQESKDLFVDEAMLTGETFPVEKVAGVLPANAPLGTRSNAVWMGTSVVSGNAQVLIVCTGKATEFGKVSERLRLRPAETDFEKGIRLFGYFLMEVTLLLVVAIFAINVFLARPVLDSFLFSLALAVGLTPQLLPAIISINLAHGAKRMAKSQVIVKRLASIENFGSMNVICSDKTGTLTEGTVRVQSACDPRGAASVSVFRDAYLNAHFQTGFANPIDEAILMHQELDVTGVRKLDEIPYDFLRKRLSILTSHEGRQRMVTKGALQNILDVCDTVDMGQGELLDLTEELPHIQRQFEAFSSNGYRTLGIAYRDMGDDTHIGKQHEANLVFTGFLVLFDPPKPNILETITTLKTLGVALKVITGDNHLVAANISRQMGLANTLVLKGQELVELSDAALVNRVARVDVFAEVEPNQKERIIVALRKAGNVVGYMGDGMNDASALHAADVGISVAGAADVAKEAADIVLLEKDLSVLVQGVREGRATFANTLKYVFMATSANFGNMFSLAGISLFLPFLPLLPKQILLTNLMTDVPEMTIATDSVDSEMVDYPRRWDIKAIRKFMLTFGILSSLFDYLTFAMLLLVLDASKIQFRTGWFVESVVSASLIVLVVRSRRPFFRSRPGKHLLIATLTMVALSVLVPFTPLARALGFSPLPYTFLLMIAAIVALYVLAAELTKRAFYKMVQI